MPLLTLFTAPKPFVDPHVSMIQFNALRSWKLMGEQVQIALIGGEAGIAEIALELNLMHFPHVACNHLGTPLISSIFDIGRHVIDSPFLAYANADIIFFPDFPGIIQRAGTKYDKFLMVGQRWDLAIKDRLTFETDWEAQLRKRARLEGKLHVRTGSDYFAFPRKCFQQIPDFTVGRAGWDNWMIYEARQQDWAVIDSTNAVDIIHQNHDYSHLPGGKPHYHLPETDTNIQLAGGRRMIFELDDSTHCFDGSRIKSFPGSWKKFWREVEIFPLVKWHFKPLTQFLFTIFHPRQAWVEFWKNRAMKKAQEGA